MGGGTLQPPVDGTGNVPEGLDRWRFRRRMVFGCAIFLAILIAYVVVGGNPENSLHRMVLDNGLWGLVALVGVYIGAPIADDWLQTRKINA